MSDQVGSRAGRSREGDSHHLDHLGSHHLGEKPRRGQSSIGRGVLRRRSDRWNRESADLARSPILMVARTNRDDARRPKPRRGQSSFRSFRQSPFRHGVRGIPSQQSRSTVVHLEVFTSRATHASPLHGFIDPTARGMHPSAPVSFLRRGDSGEGDSHHLGSHHLGAVSGAFPVNNRGRRWFIWRSLRAGRRMRRPDTDLSTPPRLGCTPRRPFRSSGEGTGRRRGQSSFGRDGEKGEKGTVII